MRPILSLRFRDHRSEKHRILPNMKTRSKTAASATIIPDDGDVERPSVETADDFDLHLAPISDPTCQICQVDVGTISPEGVKEAWALTPCGHALGNVCLKRYLALMVIEKPCCPICRQTLTHECGHPILPIPYKPKRTRRGTSAEHKRNGSGSSSSSAGHVSEVEEVIETVELHSQASNSPIQKPWGDGVDPRYDVCNYCNESAAASIAAQTAQRHLEEEERQARQARELRRQQYGRWTRIVPPFSSVKVYLRLQRGQWRLKTRRLHRKPRRPSAAAAGPGLVRVVSNTGVAQLIVDEEYYLEHGRRPGDPPVPGEYGHWDLATREPDWEYMKWFDAQEPTSVTSKEDWSR